MQRHLQRGDRVIYRATKYTPRPGPRAEDVHPAPRGENYLYHVDKFWTVAESRDDGSLLLITRRGKTHVVYPGDPNLRPANLWEKLFYRRRFPALPS